MKRLWKHLQVWTIWFLTCLSEIFVVLLLLCTIRNSLLDQWVFPQTNPSTSTTTTILLFITIIIASPPASLLTRLAQKVCNCIEL